MCSAVAVGRLLRVSFISEVSRQDNENARQWALVESNLAANLRTLADFRAALRQLGDLGMQTLPIMKTRTTTKQVVVRPAGFLRAAVIESRQMEVADRVGQFEGWQLSGWGNDSSDLWRLRDARLTVQMPSRELSELVLLVDGQFANFASARLYGLNYYIHSTFSNTPSISAEEAAKVQVGDEAARPLGWVEPVACTSLLAKLLRHLRE